MNKVIIYILLFFVVNHCWSQNNQEIDSTFPAELRKVKQASWQQKVNFEINVSLNDSLHVLNGFEKIEYINNSPDNLSEIWFHLWPNAYKNDETPFAKQQLENNKTEFYYSQDQNRGYIDSLDFSVDGESVVFKYGSSIDIGYIKLNKPLKPGEYCIIKTPFRVKIPYTFSRLGHVDQSYQITQWFPKPAVYDVNGWNSIPYLDQGEFYSEFGDFKVSILLPDSYIVATTGIKTHEHKIGNKKEVTFTENNIHDFAWFADKKYMVDSETVTLKSGKKVACYMYFKDVKNNGIKALKDAVIFRSDAIADYPYSHIAAVASNIKAGAGMEYPCITVVLNADEGTIEHEVGHNWFYGILANYERAYAWMDEGLNSYYDIRYAEQKNVLKKNNFIKKNFEYNYTNEEFQHRMLWAFQSADHEEQEINQPSENFTFLNYGAIVYGKTALCLKHLEAYLSKNILDSAMHIYYEEWKFKHPLPEDFRVVMERVTGKNLSWFFDLLIKTNKRIDYKILGRYKEKNRPRFWVVDIENVGEVNAPFFIGGFKEGKLIKTIKVEGFWGQKSIAFIDTSYDFISIDPEGVTVEINRKNNTIKTHGFLKKTEPIKLKFGFSLNNPFKTQINWLPIIARNNNDGWMYGLALYNQSLLTKNNSFSFMPMYGIKSKALSGIASFSKKIFFENELTKCIELNIDFRKFQLPDSLSIENKKNYYTRLSPEIYIYIKKSTPRSPIDNSINLKYIHIENFTNKQYAFKDNFFNITYRSDNKRAINPYEVSSLVQLHTQFQKLTTEIKGGLNLNKPTKKIYYRFFGGYMYYNKLQNPKGINQIYSFKPEGNTGFWDYTYENLMLDRIHPAIQSNRFSQKQIIEKDGALKTPFSFGYISDTWMVASNIRCPFPGKIPLEIYADMCLFSQPSFDPSANEIFRTVTFRYTTGISLILIRDVCEVYFPIYMSKQMQESYFYSNTKYLSKISWKLNISKLNIFSNKRSLLEKTISQ